MDLKSLKDIIPKYETVPLWWNDGWCLFYINIWGKIYYMSPQGSGELHGRKFFLYEKKPQPEFIIEKREYREWIVFGDKILTRYCCPNCDNDLVPYDYDFDRQLIGHIARVKYCTKCGYPLLW